MVYIPKNPGEKQALLEAVRMAIGAAGGRSITLRKFLDFSGLNRRDIFKYYAGWNELTSAAGFDFDSRNRALDVTRLLADWGAVARKLQRIPSRKQYTIHGSYHPCTLESRFGSWTAMPAAFRAFAVEKREEWSDVIALIEASGSICKKKEAMPPPSGRPRKKRCEGKLVSRLNGRPMCGHPLDFGGLRHAPTNEFGVVFLFGIMAERLGFLVEGFQAAFPDCEAKRKAGSAGWQNVKIEFEYESRNFRDHGHDPKACDLIVCWVHNWAECPVEVIALGEEIEKLEERIWKSGNQEKTNN